MIVTEPQRDPVVTVIPALDGLRALAAGLVVTELRAAGGAGLEDMFLQLTADTQREGAAA